MADPTTGHFFLAPGAQLCVQGDGVVRCVDLGFAFTAAAAVDPRALTGGGDAVAAANETEFLDMVAYVFPFV